MLALGCAAAYGVFLYLAVAAALKLLRRVMPVSKQFDGENNSQYLTSEGKTRKDGNDTRAKWVVNYGKVDGKPTITHVHLVTRGRVPGIDQDTFAAAAAACWSWRRNIGGSAAAPGSTIGARIRSARSTTPMTRAKSSSATRS